MNEFCCVQVGGFYLPFVALGGLMIATVPLNYFCLPAEDGMYL